jgi:hypothetical protein
MPRPILPIDQKNVGIAIVVVIDECATGAHRLRQIFLAECAVVMREPDSGLSRDVPECDFLRKGGQGRADARHEKNRRKERLSHLPGSPS